MNRYRRYCDLCVRVTTFVHTGRDRWIACDTCGHLRAERPRTPPQLPDAGAFIERSHPDP